MMATVTMDPRIRARRAQVLKLRGRRRLRVIVVFVVSTVAVIGAWWLVLKSPAFDVDSITVEGATNTEVGSAIEVAGVEKGQSLLEVDLASAREAIAQLPWVETVASGRGLGGEVSFQITERVPAGVMASAHGWALVDGAGRVLEMVDSVPPGTVVIDGDLGDVTPGEWVGDSKLSSLEVAAQLPSGLRPKVATISGVGSDLDLVLFGGGVVKLGDSADLDTKFLSALTLLVHLDISCLDRIDVRAPAVPVLTRVPGCS